MKIRDEICIWCKKRVGREFPDYTARGDEAAVQHLRTANLENGKRSSCGGFMTKRVCTMLVAAGMLAFVLGTFAQKRGLPPNVPANPNWVVTTWGEPPAGKQWQALKSVDSVNFDPNGKGSMVVLVTPADRSEP